ncbi:hypothetical protein COCON_G00187620 [Conger conger]|uniref:Uncharacterized protein n=1 Tax=Conger conger TaxID=82655 RepID=A0A9Q1HRT3_CONCO|nr:hypothetical protein COCON_G00187620 [Conger conger]
MAAAPSITFPLKPFGSEMAPPVDHQPWGQLNYTHTAPYLYLYLEGSKDESAM